MVPASVEYLSDPLVVLTAVIAMPSNALESTSEIPETRAETRVPAVEFPLVGASVSSLMAVRAGEALASREGASLTLLIASETACVELLPSWSVATTVKE